MGVGMAAADAHFESPGDASTVSVSAVIPAYNAQSHLAECLASVSEQSGRFTLEIIVVDDGSRDATAEIARRHPGVQCITQANAGPSAARNVGIASARGEFIAFLDADDLWPAGKLAAQLDVLLQHPEAALVCGDCRQFDARGRWPRTEYASNGVGAGGWDSGELVPQAYSRLLENNFITTGSVVARRAMLQEAGGFAEDLRLVEDLDLWLRMARRHPIAWCALECLLRRRHDANISGNAEAVALAYLDVLERHRKSWGPGDAAALGVDAGWLESKEYLHLAELAVARGVRGVALQRVWRGLVAHPHPRTFWRSAKTAVKAILRTSASRA
jgi:glycosyltransferase involved in cell wall biosynthesis